MASTPITFSITKAHDTNKKIEQDENGYYYVTLGAINSYNSQGMFYIADGVKELVEDQSTLFTRRLKSGYLNGELGHPDLLPGMTNDEFINRNLVIDISNVSHHIRSVEFVPTNIPSGKPGAGNVIKIMGWVKPSGAKGDILKQSLDNPDQNTAFSIRCLTYDDTTVTPATKKIIQIITWDFVIEPGIKYANSWSTLESGGVALESRDILTFDLKDSIESLKNIKGLSIEAQENLDMLRNLESRIKPKSAVDAFSRW